eukprot:s10370_g1.t1
MKYSRLVALTGVNRNTGPLSDHMQCSVTPNPTTPAEFETTPSRIPAFLQEEQTDIQEDMGCDVVKKFSTNMMLQGSEGTTTDQNGEDTPSPFLLSDIEALQKDPLEEPWSS